jgi:hypothetical protein
VLQIVIGFPAVEAASGVGHENNLEPLAAFIAQQFPTQNLFEDTIQEATCGRARQTGFNALKTEKTRALFFPVLPNSDNYFFI